MRPDLRKTQRIVLLALFLAYALIVAYAEARLFPLDFAIPGVKLGLGNVVILTALYLFSPLESLGLVALKCVLSAAFLGGVSALFYSLGGSLLSFAVMCLLVRSASATFSPVGISVIGAVFHNLGQLAVAALVLQSAAVFAYLPVLLASGAITGVLVGLAVRASLPLIRNALNR